jgi:predicted GIY-YIG superfamily endonuclease
MCRIGFSPRAKELALYGMGVTREGDLLARLGKHGTGKGCLYVKRLADVDMAVLEELARRAVAHMREAYPD